MLNTVKENAHTRMKKAIEALKTDLSKLRTGRAYPSLLDHITVDYYGSIMPLNQVGSVAAQDSRTLAITPWDKKMIPIIEKAIMTSDLGLTPTTTSEVIRVPVPALTEERRKDLIKIVKQEGENTRVSIRNIRRDANNEIKALLKDKAISEDDERRATDEIQKLTDSYIMDVDKTLAAKEKDLLEI